MGLFDTLGRAGLNADVSASSGTSQRALWTVFGRDGGSAGLHVGHGRGHGANRILAFRQHDTPVNVPAVNSHRPLDGHDDGLHAASPSGPDGAFTFAPNTTYTGSMTITRLERD